MKVTLNNVRGFVGNHELIIKPLTVLIGENSSGKTTLLATIFAALSRDFPTAENLFNRSPFELGSFDTIATYRGGKFGRAANFSVGWEVEAENRRGRRRDELPRSMNATFENDGGTPRLSRLCISNTESQIIGSFDGDQAEFEITANMGKKDEIKHSFKAPQTGIKFVRIYDVLRIFYASVEEKNVLGTKRGMGKYGVLFEALDELLLGSGHYLPSITALAPLRTRPRRTYDELNDEFKPEGDHVPLVLARLLKQKGAAAAQHLAALTKYGINSGLFEKIDVKRLGKQPSDPFQVRIKMKGPDANLIDVGYGVSQSLPIVVDSLTAEDGQVLLIQQPEVHLHPKAQAALGTFFADLVTSTNKRVIIETHSDYLVDRIRIAVANGIMKPDQVQLLYLDRHGLDINIHDLKLDDLGNITNAPDSYRQFFLQEELSLMSRGA